jgi:hypothetical protein
VAAQAHIFHEKREELAQDFELDAIHHFSGMCGAKTASDRPPKDWTKPTGFT